MSLIHYLPTKEDGYLYYARCKADMAELRTLRTTLKMVQEGIVSLLGLFIQNNHRATAQMNLEMHEALVRHHGLVGILTDRITTLTTRGRVNATHYANLHRKMTQEEINMARSGRRIEAIKSVRDRLGIGIGDAKALVDATVPKPPAAAPVPYPGLLPIEFDMAKQGDYLGAIKMVRARLGCGLAEARDLVEKTVPSEPTLTPEGPTLTSTQIELCAQGNHLEAIRSVRLRTSLDIRTAKELVPQGMTIFTEVTPLPHVRGWKG